MTKKINLIATFETGKSSESFDRVMDLLLKYYEEKVQDIRKNKPA